MMSKNKTIYRNNYLECKSVIEGLILLLMAMNNCTEMKARRLANP